MGTEPSTRLGVYTGADSTGQQEAPGTWKGLPWRCPLDWPQEMGRGWSGVELTLETQCEAEESLKHQRCSAFPCG